MGRYYIRGLGLAAVILCSTCTPSAYGADYTVDGSKQALFGEPTTEYSIPSPIENIDRSKNSAYIPPLFGSPSMDLRGTGIPLTPNLLQKGENFGTNGSGVTQIPNNNTDSGGNSMATSFTPVVSDLYYSGGYLATLKIPAIDLSVKVYQGTGSAELRKGAGHFESTSIWNGNIAVAAHNRGVNNHFGKIHTLEDGDHITLTTKLGTRTYRVYSIRKISETDNSILAATSDNILTLVTCVRDERDYRWCVQAVEEK